MPEPLTGRHKEVYDCIREHILLHGYSPTIRWLCERFGWKGYNSAQVHVDRLIKKGWLKRGLPGSARTLTLTEELPGPLTEGMIRDAATALFISDGGQEATHFRGYTNSFTHTHDLTLERAVSILCRQLGIRR